MPDEVDLIRRELSGRNYEPDAPGKRKPARPGRQRPAARQRQPQASERASMLAQAWYDQGNRTGFDFPYDVNYFALALARKIEKDPELRRSLEANPDGEQVSRWVRKMIERWWAEYATNEVHARNAKEYFLENDWEDLREYARSCLRAAYLKAHGRRVKPPEYPMQREHRAALEQVRVNDSVARLDTNAEPAVELDESRLERLRSWRKSHNPRSSK